MNRIKELRKAKGLSQVEFAKVMHVDQTAVSQWETGKTSPNTETALAAADYLGVSADYLLGRDIQDNIITNEQLKHALFKGDKGISDAQLDEVKKFAAFIKERDGKK